MLMTSIFSYCHYTCTLSKRVIVNLGMYNLASNTRKGTFAQLLNPFPNKLRFLRVCRRSLLKTLWENEKLLITSNFHSHGLILVTQTLMTNPPSSAEKALQPHGHSLKTKLILLYLPPYIQCPLPLPLPHPHGHHILLHLKQRREPTGNKVCILTHYQMTNFRLFQTEGVCRRQFHI